MARDKNEPRRRRDAEAIRAAATGAFVTAFVFVALWWSAPMLEASAFWQEHFPWSHPQEPLPIAGAFLVAAALGGALWPGTWEGELLTRALRGVGWAVLVYWLFAVTLEAEVLAGVGVLPLLGGPAYAAFHLARRAPSGTVSPWLAALASLLGALFVVMLAVAPVDEVLRIVLLPLPIGLFVLGAPLILHSVRERHEAAERQRRPEAGRPREASGLFLDLPAGTLRPPTSLLAVLATVSSVLFVVLVVAPGVPLSGPVAWIGLTLSLPVLVWTVLRRPGVAHPRRLVAPDDVAVHEARVAHLRDQDLDRLDDAIARFVRTGRGRSDLADALESILKGSGVTTGTDQVEGLLAPLPRAPWRKKAREEGLAHILGGRSLLRAARSGGGRR